MENWTEEDCKKWLEYVGDMPVFEQLLLFGFSVERVPEDKE